MGDHKGRPYMAFVADIEWQQAVLFHARSAWLGRLWGAFRWNLNIQPQQTKTADVAKANSNKAMVEHLINTLPLGTFKAGDVQEVVKKRWPQHVAGSSSGTCGKWLRDVWPLLEVRGIKEVRTNSPRTYEITEGAKKIN